MDIDQSFNNCKAVLEFHLRNEYQGDTDEEAEKEIKWISSLYEDELKSVLKDIQKEKISKEDLTDIRFKIEKDILASGLLGPGDEFTLSEVLDPIFDHK